MHNTVGCHYEHRATRMINYSGEQMWQLKNPQEGSNTELTVVLYCNLASFRNILTFTCKF